MGYLAQGKEAAFFIRLQNESEFNRLHSIFKGTKNKRIKRKLAKKIDDLVPVR